MKKQKADKNRSRDANRMQRHPDPKRADSSTLPGGQGDADPNQPLPRQEFGISTS